MSLRGNSMKYIVSVGDVLNNYPCFACFDCCDLQEMLECFEGVSTDELKNYTLVLGEKILKGLFGMSVVSLMEMLSIQSTL